MKLPVRTALPLAALILLGAAGAGPTVSASAKAPPPPAPTTLILAALSMHSSVNSNMHTPFFV